MVNLSIRKIARKSMARVLFNMNNNNHAVIGATTTMTRLLSTKPHQQETIETFFHATDESIRVTPLTPTSFGFKEFAVDGPDGEDDGHFEEEMTTISDIIEHAAQHEDKTKIDFLHHLQLESRVEAERHPEHDW